MTLEVGNVGDLATLGDRVARSTEAFVRWSPFAGGRRKPPLRPPQEDRHEARLEGGLDRLYELERHNRCSRDLIVP